MDSSSRIFVKGLPPSLTVEEFQKHFSKQSPITDAKFIPHRRIGYVGFPTPEDAMRAVKYHNRSFIRMSRIGVELARSVDEQQQALRPYRSGAYVSSSLMTHNSTERYEGGIDTTDATAPASKRRRISAKYDMGDDKLQEFLQVMQPPGKFKSWDDQVVATSAQKLGPAMELETPTVLTADNKSDLEYEQVPREKKRPEKRERIPSDDASKEPLVAFTDDARGSRTIEIQEVEGNDPRPELEVAPPTTDDDWLRSRTSRLLGLVEDDEASNMKPSTLGQEKTNDKDNDESSQRGLRKDSEVGFETEKVPKSIDYAGLRRGSEASEEPIEGNARLFLRNLTYTSNEDSIREYFETNGFNGVEEVGTLAFLPSPVSRMMNFQIGTTYAMQLMSTGRDVLVDISCF